MSTTDRLHELIAKLEIHDLRRWARIQNLDGSFLCLRCHCGQEIQEDSNEAMFKHVAEAALAQCEPGEAAFGPFGRRYCQETVAPYWNTLLECTSETCHRPLPCVVHTRPSPSQPTSETLSTAGAAYVHANPAPNYIKDILWSGVGSAVKPTAPASAEGANKSEAAQATLRANVTGESADNARENVAKAEEFDARALAMAEGWRKSHEMQGEDDDRWDIWGNASAFDRDLAKLLAAGAASGAQPELSEALAGVPDPEQEGYCSSCGGRLELIKIGDAYKWQHLPHCWYARVQNALLRSKVNSIPVR